MCANSLFPNLYLAVLRGQSWWHAPTSQRCALFCMCSNYIMQCGFPIDAHYILWTCDSLRMYHAISIYMYMCMRVCVCVCQTHDAYVWVGGSHLQSSHTHSASGWLDCRCVYCTRTYIGCLDTLCVYIACSAIIMAVFNLHSWHFDVITSP